MAVEMGLSSAAQRPPVRCAVLNDASVRSEYSVSTQTQDVGLIRTVRVPLLTCGNPATLAALAAIPLSGLQ